MKKMASRILVIFLIIQLVMSCVAPVIVYANDATMIEPLIEPNTKTYKVDIVTDSHGWFSGHYEDKFMSFYNYYNNICQSSVSGTDRLKGVKDELINNPGFCMGLDDSIKEPTTMDASGNPIPGQDMVGYGFFLKAEGYANASGLVTDDSKKKEVLESLSHSFAGTTNDFLDGQKGEGLKVMTFPGVHGSGAKDVTQAETEYAITVGNTLGESLNAILTAINGGKRYSSVTELVNKSILIRPTNEKYTIIDTGDGNDINYIIVYGNRADWGNKIVPETSSKGSAVQNAFTIDDFVAAGWPNADADGNLLAYVIPTSQDNPTYRNIVLSKIKWDEVSSYIWAMPKGYIKIDGVNNSLKFTDSDHKEYSFAEQGKEAPWITIHHISMYANNALKNHNVDISTKTSATDSGNWIMALIVEIFQSLLQGLRTILGLSDMHTLVYNKGARASASYNYGAMSDAWWTVVLRYHLIFQSLAWFLIICGFIKVLIDLNLSTINPGKRLSVLETVQRFIVVGFLLVTIIPIIQFLLNMNSSIVNIFASQVDPNATEAPVIASLAGLILQFAYFAICVYINFVYIMRSIIIGILTVTAPFFIASMAFSQNNKTMFTEWAKQLLGNIFMQSIHAFSLAFLTNLVATGGGLESLVVSYSMIPLTELIRNLIFPGVGAAESLGKNAGMKAINMGTAAVGAAANGLAAKGLDKTAEPGEKGGAEGQGSGNAGGSGNMGKSSKVEQLSSQLNQQATNRQDAIKGMNKDLGGTSISGNRAMAKNALGKAARNIGMAGIQTMGMAMAMTKSELSGDVNGYSDFGKGAVDVATSAGKGMSDLGTFAGSATHAAGQHIQAAAQRTKGADGKYSAIDYDAIREDGQVKFSGQEVANRGYPNVMGIKTNAATGTRVTQVGANTGGTFSNIKGGISESIGKGQLESAAQWSQPHALVNTAMNSTDQNAKQAAYKQLKAMNISFERQGDGGARINYGNDYMNKQGWGRVDASKDGKSLYIQNSVSSNVPTSFTSAIPGGASPSYRNTHVPHQQPQNN